MVERSPRRQAVGSNPTSPIIFVAKQRSAWALPAFSLKVNEAVFTTIAFTGFTVAFFHAAIPTHWLPFVLTARAQHWNHAKALAITALAGSGHVLFTAVLGLLLTLFGFALHEKIGNWFPRIAGGALVVFGLFYLYRQLIGKVHGHSRVIGEDPQVHAAHRPRSDPPLIHTPMPRPVSD